jgi:ABC-2 type transport system ATP-binding protein
MPGLRSEVAPPPRTAAPPVEARAVRKRFGGKEALAGVDLSLGRGEVLALLGPNGAGKTTLVSVLLGLRRPDSGSVLLFGSDPRRPRARLRIGAALQESSFPMTLRVQELVDLVAAHYPDPAPRDELLERFSLTGCARRQAGALSGGQRRRLAVALAFAGRPQAVFLDEPSAALDLESRRALWAIVREHAQGGGSVLLTTHHLDEAEALASRVAVIDRGAIVASASPSELREQVGETRVRLRADSLPPLGNAVRVEQTGDVATIYTRDSAALLAELLRAGIEPAGLEVVPVSLEEAFLQLTSPGREP